MTTVADTGRSKAKAGTSFGPLKKIDASPLNLGWAEAGLGMRRPESYTFSLRFYPIASGPIQL